MQISGYKSVQQLPAVSQHGTMNHSIEFVNPSTGVHTQNMESYWNRVTHSRAYPDPSFPLLHEHILQEGSGYQTDFVLLISIV